MPSLITVLTETAVIGGGGEGCAVGWGYNVECGAILW